MTFRTPSNTGPPRTTTGFSGLGAVGGPRGVGAGALRVIVEFLTQYDAQKVKQLEADLSRLEKLGQLSDARSSKANKAAAADEAVLSKLKQLRLTLSSAEVKEIRKIRDAERTRSVQAQQTAKTLRTAFAQASGLRSKDIDLLVNQDRIEDQMARKRVHRAAVERKEGARRQQIQQQSIVAERQLFNLQQIRQQVIPKLGSLALGAVGGILGGAVIGLGFAAAQAGLEAIGNLLRDMFDPANKAREALKGVAQEINALANKEGITTLEASKQILDELGIAADQLEPELLAAAAATQALIEKNEKLAEIVAIVTHEEELRRKAIAENFKLLAEARGVQLSGTAFTGGGPVQQIERGDISRLNPQQLALYNEVLKEFSSEATKGAAAAQKLAAEERQLAGAAQLASFAQDQLSDSIRRIAGLRITGLQDQLAAITSAGPSARTQGITAQIEANAEASARAAAQSQLTQLAEQRSLLLLEQRVRFQGQSINLDRVSGRVALVAINARISALQRAGQLEQGALDAVNAQIQAARQADQERDRRDQAVLDGFNERIEAIQKEGDAQDRVNKLLDLQFKMSQNLERQQGESIADFIQRRAQEGRELLAEQAALRREEAISTIEAERDEVAAIQETADARRETAIEAMELEAQRLQAAIEASQKARDAEIAALQDRAAEVELQVQLEENARAQQEVRDQERSRRQGNRLQEELQRSQERDRKETEARKKAIEEQIRSEQDRLDQILKYADIEQTEKLRIAAEAARTYADAQALIGELAGSRRALAELEAWVKANKINPELAEPILGPLREVVLRAGQRVDQLIGARFGHGHLETHFAKGGIIDLSNSRSPFGQNIHFGEEGREIGLILSNRISRMLEGKKPPVGSQHFTINKSDDPFRDGQRAKRVVKEAIEEALR